MSWRTVIHGGTHWQVQHEGNVCRIARLARDPKRYAEALPTYSGVVRVYEDARCAPAWAQLGYHHPIEQGDLFT